MFAVCSNRIRAATKTSGFGNQWWRREVYHLSDDQKTTRCGIDASEWLVIGPATNPPDKDCCTRCRKTL